MAKKTLNRRTARLDGQHDLEVEKWLKAEGILQNPPRPAKNRKQYKSIDGQQSLLEVDENGKPVVHRTSPTKKKRR